MKVINYQSVTLNGNGTATVARPMTGLLGGIYIDPQHGGGTADVTFRSKGSDIPQQTFMTITNAVGTGWYHPQAAVHDSSAAATGGYVPWEIDDYLQVVVVQGDAGGTVDVTFMVIEG